MITDDYVNVNISAKDCTSCCTKRQKKEQKSSGIDERIELPLISLPQVKSLTDEISQPWKEIITNFVIALIRLTENLPPAIIKRSTEHSTDIESIITFLSL